MLADLVVPEKTAFQLTELIRSKNISFVAPSFVWTGRGGLFQRGESDTGSAFAYLAEEMWRQMPENITAEFNGSEWAVSTTNGRAIHAFGRNLADAIAKNWMLQIEKGMVK